MSHYVSVLRQASAPSVVWPAGAKTQTLDKSCNVKEKLYFFTETWKRREALSSWRPAGYPLWENTGNLQGVAQWGGGGQEQNAPPRATYGHFGVILELSIFKCFYLMSWPGSAATLGFGATVGAPRLWPLPLLQEWDIHGTCSSCSGSGSSHPQSVECSCRVLEASIVLGSGSTWVTRGTWEEAGTVAGSAGRTLWREGKQSACQCILRLQASVSSFTCTSFPLSSFAPKPRAEEKWKLSGVTWADMLSVLPTERHRKASHRPWRVSWTTACSPQQAGPTVAHEQRPRGHLVHTATQPLFLQHWCWGWKSQLGEEAGKVCLSRQGKERSWGQLNHRAPGMACGLFFTIWFFPSLAVHPGSLSATSILSSCFPLLTKAQTHLLNPISSSCPQARHLPDSVEVEGSSSGSCGQRSPVPELLYTEHYDMQFKYVLFLNPRWQYHIFPGPGFPHFPRDIFWGMTKRKQAISMTVQLSMAQFH